MSTTDMLATPWAWVERPGGIDDRTEIDRGPHITELEVPEVIVDDLPALSSELR